MPKASGCTGATFMTGGVDWVQVAPKSAERQMAA